MAGPRPSPEDRDSRKDRAVSLIGWSLLAAVIIPVVPGVLLYVSGQ